jgi:hypothetical protein
VVVSKDETVPITNINGKRQLFEQPRGHFEELFVVMKAKGDTGSVRYRIRLDGGSLGFAP